MNDQPTHRLRFADLPNRRASEFELTPSADDRADIAAALELLGLKKFAFSGQIAPLGDKDWELTAKLGATVVQPCVVTLDPVTTRIDEIVTRRYLAEMPELTGIEIEMPEDESAEQRPDSIDLYEIALEALALALPAFPRAAGAEVGQVLAAAPGINPLTDEDAKPFAGLAALRDKLENEDPDGSE